MGQQIIITGATGLIGSYITQKLSSRGDQIIIFSRNPESSQNELPGAKDYVKWDSFSEGGKWESYLDGADAVIHLAGEPLIGELWSDEYKEKILKSRQLGTRGLVRAIEKAAVKPKSFICASAIGYYGSSEDDSIFTEKSPAGMGFLAEVCKKWEAESAEVDKLGVRRVNVRVGIVLDKNEGALEKILTPFMYYMGGTVGSGDQWVSWIHNRDVANIFIHALDNETLTGPLNGTAPNPVRMNEFAETLGGILNRPSWLKIPETPIKAAIGEASVPVTEGIRVLPERTLESGFEFEFIYLREALKNLLGK